MVKRKHWSGRSRATGSYWEIGGVGGPAGAGGDDHGGADAKAGGAGAASEPPPGAVGAEPDDGAAVTGGAASGRGTAATPSRDGSTLADDCDGPSPDDLTPSGWPESGLLESNLPVSGLPGSTLAEPLAGGSALDGSSLALSPFGRSLKNSLNGSSLLSGLGRGDIGAK